MFVVQHYTIQSQYVDTYIEVKTYPQRWEPGKCEKGKNFNSRYIPAKEPEALTLLKKSIFNVLNAFEPKTAVGVVDGVILWECL